LSNSTCCYFTPETFVLHKFLQSLSSEIDSNIFMEG
jgi:hypothetical protein